MCTSLIVVLFHLEKGKTEAENSQLNCFTFNGLVNLINLHKCQNYQLHYSKFPQRFLLGVVHVDEYICYPPGSLLRMLIKVVGGSRVKNL